MKDVVTFPLYIDTSTLHYRTVSGMIQQISGILP